MNHPEDNFSLSLSDDLSDFFPWSFSDISDSLIGQTTIDTDKDEMEADESLKGAEFGQSQIKQNYYESVLNSSPPKDILDCFGEADLDLFDGINDIPSELHTPSDLDSRSLEDLSSNFLDCLSSPGPSHSSEPLEIGNTAESGTSLKRKSELDIEEKRKIPKLDPSSKLKVRQTKITGFISPVISKPKNTAAADMIVKTVPMQNDTKHSPIILSAEQQCVIDLIVEKQKNVFFTGAAGTGKSLLLRQIIKELNENYKTGQVAVTASTGIAACNIGGTTLHSFCGIGLGQEHPDILLKKIVKNSQALKRWKTVKVLIVDETSMIDGNLFDKLEYIARQLKVKHCPFGGIQVILSGDFFQLPPVFKQKTRNCLAFQAKSWKSVIEVTVELKQVFRQKDDHFSQMLGSIHKGIVTDRIEKEFKALSRPLVVPEGITPTEIFPHRYAVDKANTVRMNKLLGPAVTFISVDTYDSDFSERYKVLKYLMCPETISFKIGAQVMLIKNMDETLVNGSLGKVIGFISHSTLNVMTQLPSKYADKVLAGTISVEEGVEFYLEEEESLKRKLENDGIFENFTECDELEDTTSIGWTDKKLLIESLLKKQDANGKKWPYVRFILPDGKTRNLLVQAEKWNIENQQGKVEASRVQVPLILAWALSVHKCQGQTMHWVKVDLRKVFEHGQSYVALSRAVNMNGLQVIGFDKSKVTVHSDVVEYYRNLPSPLDI